MASLIGKYGGPAYLKFLIKTTQLTTKFWIFIENREKNEEFGSWKESGDPKDIAPIWEFRYLNGENKIQKESERTQQNSII